MNNSGKMLLPVRIDEQTWDSTIGSVVDGLSLESPTLA